MMINDHLGSIKFKNYSSIYEIILTAAFPQGEEFVTISI